MSKPDSRVVRYLKVARADFFITSLLPVLVALSAAVYAAVPVNWPLFPVVAVGAVSVHSMVNLVSEYYDFKRGVDRPGDASSVHPIASGEVSPKEAAVLAYLSLGLCLVALLVLSYYRGALLFFMGLAGIAGGYSYTGPPVAYKYKSYGDILIFFLMGPLLVMGAYYGFTGELSILAFLVSIPQGLLIAAVLNSNNIRDIDKDKEAGIKNIPVVIGRHKASILYSATVFLSFAWIILCTAAGIFPVYSLSVLLIFFYAVKTVKKLNSGNNNDLDDIDLRTVKIYLGVNFLLALSLIAGFFS